MVGTLVAVAILAVPALVAAWWWHEAAHSRLGAAGVPGVVALGLAGPRRSAEILRSWQAGAPEDEREPAGERTLLDVAATALRRDTALALALTVLLAALAALAAGALPNAWTLLAAFGIVGGAFDLAENSLLLRRVGAARRGDVDAPRAEVRATRLVAAGKFLFYAAAALPLAVLVYGVLPALVLALLIVVSAALRARARRAAGERRERREHATREHEHTLALAACLDGIDDPRQRATCDVILKGGVTSGVIYPPALVRLAYDYRFCSVGGTSAGAVAAGAAAAAEYGRRPGNSGGFTLLHEVGRELAEPAGRYRTRVRSLFQSERGTEPLLALVEAWQRGGALPLRVLRVLRVAAARYPWRVGGTLVALGLLLWLGGWLLGIDAVDPRELRGDRLARVLAGVWLLEALSETARADVRSASIMLAVATGIVALGVLATALGGLLGLRRTLLHELPRNGFGICSGATAPGTTVPALTDWLTDTFDRVAGVASVPDRPAGPLRFGDLWGVDDAPPGDLRHTEGRPPAGAEVVLELVTTNLSEARPLRLPYDLEDYWFSPAELQRLFPRPVTTWLAQAGQARLVDEGLAAASTPAGEPLLPMPCRADLPVVVAVRMSLSLPLVLSAVPLWRVSGEGPERCWFGDGGLTSNFPVHMFDGPVPRRPTFAFNLRRWPAGVREPLVEVPVAFAEGPQRLQPVEGVGGFVGANWNAALTWTDEALSRHLGYRERIAHIYHSRDEGGMNLRMPRATIEALGRRGYLAADQLARRYLPGREAEEGVEVSWDAHRWVRVATAFAALEEHVALLVERWNDPSELHGQPSYDQLLAAGEGEGYPPQPFPLSLGLQARLTDILKQLDALCVDLRRLEHGADGTQGRGVRERQIALLRPSPRN